MNPNTKCYICSKPIYRIPSRLTDHNVCSYACRNKYFSAEKSFAWKVGKEYIKSKRIIYEKKEKRKNKNKQKAINLLGGKCCVCGYKKCIAAIDFHHKDPTKKDFSIKNLSHLAWERMKKEVIKCVLLCANCHREHHWKEKNERETYKSSFS